MQISNCKEHWRSITLLLALVEVLAVGAQTSSNSPPPLQWKAASTLQVEGRGWSDTQSFYDRLPERAGKIVRPAVWGLSHDSAGICVRFVTDATTISARWILRKDSLSMPHMPATGVSGVDLYVRQGHEWRWLAIGRAKQVTNEVVLVQNLPPAQREYALYVPLYNGVSLLEIGVPAQAELRPAVARNQLKPIVFYGTSIVQGGCASRPGMAHTAIIGRRLDCPVINLGFSGNAWSEPEMAQLLAELDPSVYVLDPLPNMTAEMVKERIEPLVRTLRQKHPLTPIVLVENLHYTDGFLVAARRERYLGCNQELRRAYQRLLKAGDKHLRYISGDDFIGNDGDGTVDGTHPTDLGFYRMANKLEPVLRPLLKTRN